MPQPGVAAPLGVWLRTLLCWVIHFGGVSWLAFRVCRLKFVDSWKNIGNAVNE